MKKIKWNIYVALILNGISIMFIVSEMFMGNTILGNAILLGMALILSFSGALFVVVGSIKQPNKFNILSLLFSTAIIAYVLIMEFTGSIPAGYGP